jgi:hypothetical protein
VDDNNISFDKHNSNTMNMEVYCQGAWHSFKIILFALWNEKE